MSHIVGGRLADTICDPHQAFDFVPAPTHILEYTSTSISAIFWVILALPGVWFGPVGKYYYRAVLSVFYAVSFSLRWSSLSDMIPLLIVFTNNIRPPESSVQFLLSYTRPPHRHSHRSVFPSPFLFYKQITRDKKLTFHTLHQSVVWYLLDHDQGPERCSTCDAKHSRDCEEFNHKFWRRSLRIESRRQPVFRWICSNWVWIPSWLWKGFQTSSS